MSESRFWSYWLKPALHRPPSRFARKIQDHWNRGLPDVLYALEGRVGLLELKWFKSWPVRVSTPVRLGVTLEQQHFLDCWGQASAVGHVLLGVGSTRSWFLYSPEGAKRCNGVSRADAEAASDAAGSFGDFLPLIAALRDRPGAAN